MRGDGTCKSTQVSNALVADEYVDMLTDLTLSRCNAIPHARVKFPKNLERIRQGDGLLCDFNFAATVGKIAQGNWDVKGQRHDYSLIRRDPPALSVGGKPDVRGGFPRTGLGQRGQPGPLWGLYGTPQHVVMITTQTEIPQGSPGKGRCKFALPVWWTRV